MALVEKVLREQIAREADTCIPLYLDPQPLKVVGCLGFGSHSEGDPDTGPG
jgi:hypothetical protein